MPSVLATLAAGDAPSDFMAFALAVALRFLTPIGDQPRLSEHPPVFVGRLPPPPPPPPSAAAEEAMEVEATAAPAGSKRKRGGGAAATTPAATADKASATTAEDAAYDYTPGLRVSPSAGSYEFKDGDGFVPLVLRPLGAPAVSLAAVAALTRDVRAAASETVAQLHTSRCCSLPAQGAPHTL